jgi:hypothetical protein
MTRTIFAAVVALLALVLDLQPTKAYEAPWCAVIQNGTDSVYWDCQYSSFEQCYRKGSILAGNRGSCNPSPYYVANAAEHTRSTKRRARPQ